MDDCTPPTASGDEPIRRQLTSDGHWVPDMVGRADTTLLGDPSNGEQVLTDAVGAWQEEIEPDEPADPRERTLNSSSVALVATSQ